MRRKKVKKTGRKEGIGEREAEEGYEGGTEEKE